MSATSQCITITPLNTDIPAFDISADAIISVVGINSDADSVLKYVGNNRTVKEISVAEANTLISSDSMSLIPYTAVSNGDVIYINAERVKAIFADGSGSIIAFDEEGAAWNMLKATDTAAAMLILVNSIADITPIPLAQHITATTQSTSIATGALVVDGGVGIAKAVYVGGVLNSEIGVNLATNSGVTTIGAATPVTVSAAGVLTVAKTTDSTTKDTGAVIIEGGVGVEKSIFAGLTVNAGTTLSVGTDQTFAKEVNHTVSVSTTTTAATVGGSLSLVGGIGATSGNGGAISVTGGVGGATAGSVGGAASLTSGISGAGNGASGAVNVKSGVATAANTGAVTVASGVPATSGNSGAVSVATGVATTGNSGAVTVLSGAVTTGNSGAVTISTGNAGTGASGDITLSPGTASTVVGKIITSNAVIAKHKTAAINATATATAKEVATGYITSTSGAATVITLPTGTLLGSELGAAQGTVHRLYIDNTAGSNTVTIAVAVNGILSALAAAEAGGAGLLTVPSGVTGQACFELMFSSSTAYTFTRVA